MRETERGDKDRREAETGRHRRERVERDEEMDTWTQTQEETAIERDRERLRDTSTTRVLACIDKASTLVSGNTILQKKNCATVRLF